MFKNKYVSLIAAIGMPLFTNAALAALATSASVYLKSDPGSWVGGGIRARRCFGRMG